MDWFQTASCARSLDRLQRDRLDTGRHPLPVQEAAEMHPSPGREGAGARVGKVSGSAA